MQIDVNWTDGVSFVASNTAGNTVVMDGPPEFGGQGRGMRPLETLLAGLGGCSSFDVVTILQKARQEVTACRVEIQAERADAVPAVFTRIHLHFVVSGKQLKDSQVQRAVALSAEKYCSASIMLAAGGVHISHDYEILT